MKAIRMHQFGGPEVLTYEEIADPIPSPGQALVDIQAIGVNFADVYGRKGASSVDLPTIPGQEASGTIVAIGEGETDLVEGDLVAYCGVPGAYAEMQAVPTNRLIKLPVGADPRTGAAAVLQGMTAHYLVHTTYPLKNGDTCLIHAGAGGVGLLMIQMAKQLGAFVITTVSTKEKMELAHGAGADKVINYTLEDFEEETKKVTGGKGVQVAYDSVGRDTFHKSLACVTRRGLLVLFGQASGPVEPIAPQVLNAGSKFLTRPSLVDHTSTRDELDWRAREVFGWILSGELNLRVVHEFSLAEAAEAHRQLEGRATTGKIVLLP